MIDLTTGYPARYVSSVAVLAHAETGGLADALSTGLFCLPEQTRPHRRRPERLGRPVDAHRQKHGPKRRLAAIKSEKSRRTFGGSCRIKVVTSMLRVDDGAPVEVAVFQTVDQDFGGGNVGGNRNVVDIRRCAQQVHLIGSIGLGADGSRWKKSSMSTLFTGDARAILLSGAATAAGKKFVTATFSPAILLDQTGGGAGR